MARKKAAEERLSLYTTGGGPCSSTSIVKDPILDLTLSIMNEKSIYGVQNQFDGDHLITNVENVADEESEAGVNEEIILEIENDMDVEEGNVDDTTWKSYKPTSLQKPLNKKLQNVLQNTTSEILKTPSKRRLPLESHSEWTARRRPVNSANESIARKFEDLTNIKIEIANHELDIRKMEKEIKLANLKRDKEEYDKKILQNQELHELQKSCLQLDVAIKRKQLEALNNL